MANNESVDFLSQVADYLEAQGLGYASEQTGHPVDIFVHKQMDTPDNCIAIWGLPGNIPNDSVRDLIFPRFQIIVRNSSYEAGSTLMRQVRGALHDKIGWTLPNYYVFYVRCEQDGYPLGDDDKGRSEFSINFTSEIRFADSI